MCSVGPVHQGLINGSPDVDAVWRLLQDRPILFSGQCGVCVPRGVWTPFNSQNTWWWKDVYPLMYLPSCCSFRMTDIWRSFVAQRCLWELGCEMEFHQADTEQDRNPHDLMRDFSQEVVGYLRNDEIRMTLESLPLRGDRAHLKENLLRCYESLVDIRVLEVEELSLVAAWLEDCP